MVTGGASQAEVARQLNVSREAVRQWVHAYRAGGPSALASRPRRRRGRVPVAELGDLVESAGRGGRQLTTPRVREAIERAWGVSYSASSVRAILRRLGYEYSREEGWRRPEGPPSHEDARLRTG
jgi:transposase